MNVYIPLGIFLALLCFWVRNNRKSAEGVFAFSMFAIFLFCALRYQFGPDYNAYMAMHDGLQDELTAFDYTGTGSHAEIGFLLYLKLFPFFTAFIATNAILWVLANYLILKKYVSANFYWIVILYIFFNTTYLKSSTVAMRSTMVAFIFMFAFWFLIKGGIKNKVIFTALVILGGQFHTTGMALILLVLLTPNNKSILFNNYFIGAIALLGFVSFFIGGNALLQLLSESIMDNIDMFEKYSDEEVAIGEVSLSINTLLFAMMSMAIAFYLAWAGRQEQDKEYIYI